MPHTAVDNATTTTARTSTMTNVRRASRRVTRSSATIVIAIVAMVAVVGIDRGATGKVSHDSAVKVRFVAPTAAALKTSDNKSRTEVVMPSLARETTKTGAAPIELLHDLSSGPQTVMFEVTAYCPCPKCCGPNATGLTASGRKVTWNNGRFVAADKMLPFGTKLVIPGYNNGKPVEVLDRGGAIKGNKLDVFFPTHDEARQWGRRLVAVTIVR